MLKPALRLISPPAGIGVTCFGKRRRGTVSSGRGTRYRLGKESQKKWYQSRVLKDRRIFQEDTTCFPSPFDNGWPARRQRGTLPGIQDVTVRTALRPQLPHSRGNTHALTSMFPFPAPCSRSRGRLEPEIPRRGYLQSSCGAECPTERREAAGLGCGASLGGHPGSPSGTWCR